MYNLCNFRASNSVNLETKIHRFLKKKKKKFFLVNYRILKITVLFMDGKLIDFAILGILSKYKKERNDLSGLGINKKHIFGS